MSRTQIIRWSLFGLYILAGAVALAIATPAGLEFFGRPGESLTFVPAKVLGLPWSLPLFLFDDGPVTSLALVGICYALNVGAGLILVQGED
jgi:hypothetical protein